MASLLDHPDAQALLQPTAVAPAALRSTVERLDAFHDRYRPHFLRTKHRHNVLLVLRGKQTGLQRKTTEPIATQAGQNRRNLQQFVGEGGGDDDRFWTELRRHVAQELADPDAVFVRGGLGFPKKGDASCGGARQWCGRLSKVDNGPVGYFLAYAAPRGAALVDARLYLPRDWTEDATRRAATPVPAAVTFAEG